MPHRKYLVAALAPVALWGGLLSSSGCTKKDDETRPAAIPAMAGNPAPLPPPPASAPPAMPMPRPMAEPPPASNTPVDPKASISGMVLLSPARRGDVAPNDVIYLVARRIADNPQARGTLVAVKRLSAEKFPVAFTLSAADMMVPTGGFDGDVALSVRVDKDGDPITRRKGDVFGGVPKVRVGAQGVKVTLDQLQKEDESLAGPGPMAAPSLPPGHP